MSDPQKQSKFPPTQQGLEYHCASQSIELSECSEPEFRLELVEGKFLVGGTIEGSLWLLKEALIGWGLEAAIAFAPPDKWWEALRVAYEVPYQSSSQWLTFSPELFWSQEKHLPAFTSIRQERQWVLKYEEGPEELSWGSLPFNPVVDLQPYAIQPEQFIAWCPEIKLESGPLIGGGEIGTRNAIAMLLMSLGFRPFGFYTRHVRVF